MQLSFSNFLRDVFARRKCTEIAAGASTLLFTVKERLKSFQTWPWKVPDDYRIRCFLTKLLSESSIIAASYGEINLALEVLEACILGEKSISHISSVALERCDETPEVSGKKKTQALGSS